MKLAFKEDFFSNSRPIWHSAGKELDKLVSGIFDNVSLIKNGLTNLVIEFSGAFGINSSNFKISIDGEKYLLKRWSIKAIPEELEIILAMMEWLSNENLPVPSPIKFINGRYVLFYDNCLWSLFPFIDGNYFSGKVDELEDFAEMSGHLSNVLSKIPLELMPNSGPIHLSDSDDAILNIMDSIIYKWPEYFGTINSKLLRNQWDALMSDWVRYRKERIYAGSILPCHFDLHPHNALFNNGKLVAILDFESCKVLPEGYAICFNALKQCKQGIIANGNIRAASEIGANYIRFVSRKYSKVESYKGNFSDLANIEVMRRLCVIFRSNIESNNKSWNHILPIQLGHLVESKIIFN